MVRSTLESGKRFFWLSRLSLLLLTSHKYIVQSLTILSQKMWRGQPKYFSLPRLPFLFTYIYILHQLSLLPSPLFRICNISAASLLNMNSKSIECNSFQAFLESLPKENFWESFEIYQWKGIRFHPFILQSTIALSTESRVTMISY